MDFGFNPDQQALLDAVDRIASRHAAPALDGEHVFDASAALAADLAGAGLLEAAAVDELGPVGASAAVIRLAQLPACVELTASALVLPLHAPTWRGPCAVLWDGDARPARWLPVARTVIRVRGDAVDAAGIDPATTVMTLDSPFGYPVGRLHAPERLVWQPLTVDAETLRTRWRAGLAAELTGSLAAALDAVVQHVRDRRQFGRPLGSFQAVQHRLAEAAVRVEAMRWLALQAAHSGRSADAAAAAGYAQQAAEVIVYDLHQFMGAMGLTLEHPLHRWTTRVKMLRADLGGASAQYQALARATWGATEVAAA